MPVEVLFLAVICGITLLAYLIAINAHGSFRIVLSYFLATLMLAGSVYLIVQYVNKNLETKKAEELTMIEIKKKAAEEESKKNAEMIARQNKIHTEVIKKLIVIVSSATNYASLMQNVDLQNKNMNFEALLEKATETKQKVDELSKQYSGIDSVKTFYPDSYILIKEGIKCLSEAAVSYKSFYYAEDSAQEMQREKNMRLRAKDAFQKLNKASTLLND